MANEFYEHGLVPAQNSALSSAAIRAEYDAIEAAFDKLPVLTGNGLKLVRVNASGTALEAVDTAIINGGAINNTTIGATTPSTGAFTTLSTTGLATLASATVGGVEVVTLSANQTLTNKTLTSPTITGATITGGSVSSLATDIAIADGGTGASTAPAALSNLGALAAQTQAKTGAYTVVANDRGDVIYCNGTFSLALTAAATLGDGFNFAVVNAGTGTITINPDGAETIDGLATKDLAPGQSAIITTNGLEFRTVGLSGGGAVGGGPDQVFYENSQTITTNYTITASKNAHSVGPITINDGVLVQVPDGSRWVIN